MSACAECKLIFGTTIWICERANERTSECVHGVCTSVIIIKLHLMTRINTKKRTGDDDDSNNDDDEDESFVLLFAVVACVLVCLILCYLQFVCK